MPSSSRRSRGWSRAHAERLLWRAGFGARPKEIDFWARRSRERTIDWLIRGGAGPHGTKRMVGPAPRANGKPLDPVNEWGHDMLWWLDKMVRSQRPLQEKLTLFWHDHFATSINKVTNAGLMFKQNLTLREHALGKLEPFLQAMSKDPAMLLWLDSNSNVKGAPNENYARALMELFSLGVGNYTEKDVQEAARSFTGWHTDDEGFFFNARQHDAGRKTVLGQTGNWKGDDVVRIVLKQPAAATFLVGKLYSFFISEARVNWSAPVTRPGRPS